MDSRHRCPATWLCLHIYIANGQCHRHFFFGGSTVNLDATRSHDIIKLFGKGAHGSFAATQLEGSLPTLTTTLPPHLPASPSDSAAETNLQIKGSYTTMACCKAPQGYLPLSIPRGSYIPAQSPLSLTNPTDQSGPSPFPPLPPSPRRVWSAGQQFPTPRDKELKGVVKATYQVLQHFRVTWYHSQAEEQHLHSTDILIHCMYIGMLLLRQATLGKVTCARKQVHRVIKQHELPALSPLPSAQFILSSHSFILLPIKHHFPFPVFFCINSLSFLLLFFPPPIFPLTHSFWSYIFACTTKFSASHWCSHFTQLETGSQQH